MCASSTSPDWTGAADRDPPCRPSVVGLTGDGGGRSGNTLGMRKPASRHVLVVAVSLVAALGSASVADAALFMTPSRNVSCATGDNNGGATGVDCTVFSESTSKGQKNWSMRA